MQIYMYKYVLIIWKCQEVFNDLADNTEALTCGADSVVKRSACFGIATNLPV
jgi:hypothetical protein